MVCGPGGFRIGAVLLLLSMSGLEKAAWVAAPPQAGDQGGRWRTGGEGEAAPRTLRDFRGGEYAEDLEEAEQWFRKGRRHRARNLWEEILDAFEEEEGEDRPAPGEAAAARYGLARIFVTTGRYEEALVELTQGRRLLDFAEFTLLEARIRLRTGRPERALELLEPLWRQKGDRELALEAGILLAAAKERIGRAPEAGRIRARIEDLGKREILRSPRAKLAYARALIGLGGGERLQEASALLIEITKQDPLEAEAYVERGKLLYAVYREARGYPSGESEFQRALENCGEVEEALVQLFLTRKDNYLLDYTKTLSYLERALALNPRSVPALRAKAARRMDDRAFEAARRLLLKALAVDPKDPGTLAEMAAVSALLARKEEEDRYRARVAAVSGGRPLADLVLGRHLIALYRFLDAVPVLARAYAAAGEDPEICLSYGKALIYAGRGEEGAALLAEVRRLRPGFVDPWRENQLLLQERLAKEYETIERGNFVFVLHPEERGVLLPYLSRTYEEAWRELGVKYGTFPDCKIRVENFARFGDFSVRTIGYQGFGALGACFGCFITSVSPAAAELRAQFSWKVTAWHEFSHVLHLKLSRARVPRWLTEGMAVYEEISLDRSYDRRMERELYSAWRNSELLPVARLNQAFRGSRILFGYYQGGLIVRHIARDFGFPKCVEMLKAYGKDKSTTEVFREVLGLSPAAYDRRFLRYVEEKVGGMRMIPRIGDAWLSRLLRKVEADPRDVEARLLLGHAFRQRGAAVDAGAQVAAIAKLAPEHPGLLLLRGFLALDRKDLRRARDFLTRALDAGQRDFDGAMALGSLLEKAGRLDEALAVYDLAAGCWPTCARPGPENPYLAKVRILKKQDKPDAAAKVLEGYVALNGRDYRARLLLAARARVKGDAPAELHHLEMARDIDPFDRRLHFRLGRLYAEQGKRERAIRALRICLATPGSKDRGARKGASALEGIERVGKKEPEALFLARVRVLLAEQLAASGDRAAAGEEARAALEAGVPLPRDLEARARRLR